VQLVVLGLNHKTAPVDIRECFAFSEEKIHTALDSLGDWREIREAVILSTCNRTELYAVVEDVERDIIYIQRFLNQMAGQTGHMEEHFYCLIENDVIRHLYRVASSLDSLVVGEGQILSQVKKAYSDARKRGRTNVVLNTLFHSAIAVGKRVRTETKIAYSAVSVSYAAVELAKKLFGQLTQCNIMILGAGKMGELTAKHLVASGVKSVFVTNRNYYNAVRLAQKFRGQAIPYEEYLVWAEKADIIITSTGAPHFIVHKPDIEELMKRRGDRPIIFIDIAVPRDVSPEVGEIPGVRVYNIDDLEAVVETNIKERSQEADKAEAIIEEDIAAFKEKMRYLSCRPTITRLMDKAEQMRQREVKKASIKMPDLSAEERRWIERMSKRIVRKVLRDPILKIQEYAGTESERKYVEAIQKLFKLEQ
jgi:glutamyl-tRNA reductase